MIIGGFSYIGWPKLPGPWTTIDGKGGEGTIDGVHTYIDRDRGFDRIP